MERLVEPFQPRSVCQAMIIRKGIVISGETPTSRRMPRPWRRYLEEYWIKRGTITASTKLRMTSMYHKIKTVILSGIVYHVGDNILVEDESNRGNWVGPIITHLSFHECEGGVEVFFQAKYYKERHLSGTSHILVFHSGSHMRLVDQDPIGDLGDDIRPGPVSQIRYKFFTFPACNGEQQEQGVLVAYELADLQCRSHLLRDGHPGLK